MTALGIILAFDALLSIFSGWVLSVMWKWFITPTFVGMPELGTVPAIGVVIIVRYLTSRPIDDNQGLRELVVSHLSHAIAKPATALAFGWIVHFFM